MSEQEDKPDQKEATNDSKEEESPAKPDKQKTIRDSIMNDLYNDLSSSDDEDEDEEEKDPDPAAKPDEEKKDQENNEAEESKDGTDSPAKSGN